MFIRTLVVVVALSFSAVSVAQDTIASGVSELPGLEGEFRVEIPGLSKSTCLKEGLSFNEELELEMFEDVSDYLLKILDRRGVRFSDKSFMARFEQKGGWGLGEELVNDAYCNSMREELASTFGVPESSTWRELVHFAKQ